MGKSRMMGTGLGSSSLYKTNPNVNTFGGNKKQGLPISVGLDPWADRASRTFSIGMNRNKLFVMNQLGGVGVGRSMFNINYTTKGGVRKVVNSVSSSTNNILKVSMDLDGYSSTIPIDSFMYGYKEGNLIHFTFKDSYSCIDSFKKFISFSLLPDNLYDIQQVINYKNLTITIDVFIQILNDFGTSEIQIKAIQNLLDTSMYLKFVGNVYCNITNILQLNDINVSEVSSTIPINYFMYGFKEGSNVHFTFKNSYTCINSFKKFIKFADNDVFPIQEVIDNKNILILFTTFIQILINDVGDPATIQYITDNLNNGQYIVFNGEVVC